MMLDAPLILASRSPRRRQLLERLGLSFTIQVSQADETPPPGAAPPNLVQQLAERKACPVSAAHPAALVLAADTVVVLDNDVLGKPANPSDARQMLARLSGRTHTVYTGIALAHVASGRRTTASEATRVTFGTLTEEEIRTYTATGSPLDKAGAYGIQDDLGALFVERIEGDYYNVVGLPLRRFYLLLRSKFDDLFRL